MRCSGSTRRSMSEGAAARSRAPDDRVRCRRPLPAGRDRRQLRGIRRRDARTGRRVRQRQVADGILDHAPRGASGSDRSGPRDLQGTRPARAHRARDAGRARWRDRADLPGTDDGAESRLHHREPDSRRRCWSTGEPRAEPRGRGPSSCSKPSASRNPLGASASTRTSFRAACGSGRSSRSRSRAIRHW